MQRRKRILVDVDEVLGDFQTPAFKVIAQVTGRLYVPEDFVVWNIFTALTEEEKLQCFAQIGAEGFCSAIKPTAGSQDAIRHLQERADVYAVTSSWNTRHWAYERDEWLERLFGIPRSRVVHTSAKYMVKGDVLLDDKPEHVETWQEEHPEGLAMLWHIPNTRQIAQHLRRVRTWQEVIEHVEALP